jgi:hypothetical protein
MSNTINRILGTGTRPTIEEPAEYRAFVDSGGRPQMGFSITRANGDMDGFLYHLLDNLNCQTRNGEEFVSFSHRGKAVTMQGIGMRSIFRAMMRHTLMEIHEQDGRPVAKGEPVVSRLAITVVGEATSPVRLAKSAGT